MNRPLHLELASNGLIWRDGFGRPVATITAVAGIGEVVRVLRGEAPASWPPQAAEHLSAVLAEVARNARMTLATDDVEPLVPRRAPPPADAAAPWG